MVEDNVELQFEMDDEGDTGDGRMHAKTDKNG